MRRHPRGDMQDDTVNKEVWNLDDGDEIGVLQSLALLELVMGNARSRILENETARTAQDEESPKNCKCPKIKRVLRMYFKIPRSIMETSNR